MPVQSLGQEDPLEEGAATNLHQYSFFFFFNKSFIYFNLAALGLSCCMWDLVPCPGIKPRPPALGVQSPSHWTTREVPTPVFLPGETHRQRSLAD